MACNNRRSSSDHPVVVGVPATKQGGAGITRLIGTVLRPEYGARKE
jgi:hypothetical protein